MSMLRIAYYNSHYWEKFAKIINSAIHKEGVTYKCRHYTKRRQIMAKVTEWFFYYFLIFKLFRVAKLKFPTFLFPNQLQIALVNPEQNQQKVAKSADFNCVPI